MEIGSWRPLLETQAFRKGVPRHDQIDRRYACSKGALLAGNGWEFGLGTDEPIAAYRAAELRLRALLLGDGMHEAGHVRGEEARARVSAQLRHLRAAFDDVVARSAAGEARILDLEEELKARAASAARRKPAARKPASRKPRTPRTP